MRTLLYIQTVEKIESFIKNNDLPKGTKLPSERRLAEKYHVSRNVIRQALLKLSENDIIELWPNDGAYIKYTCDEKIISGLRAILIQNQSSFLDALEVRQVIETAIVEKCIPYLTGEHLSSFERMYRMMNQYRNEQKIENFLRCDQTFHLQIAEIIPNPMFQMLLKTFFNIVPQNFFTLSKTLQTSMEDTQKEHRAIIDALYIQDAKAAVNAVNIHMNNIKKDLKTLENKK